MIAFQSNVYLIFGNHLLPLSQNDVYDIFVHWGNQWLS